jgi:hypothetical protein
MNVFYINQDPIIAAQMLCDHHIRKMQIECAQLLCTTFWHFGIEAPYKKSHYNHPSAKWARESIEHFDWLLNHGLEICTEFEKRYLKPHATKNVLLWCQTNKPLLNNLISTNPFTPPPQVMPDQYKMNDTLEAYKNFYKLDKIGIKELNYNKLNNQPEWTK